MAERRMFHTSVVESDAFLDLPAGAQALYFHLGMHADNDGFVNGPKQITRKLRRPAKDLQLLIDAGLLLEFDGIVVLTHWRIANTLRENRIKPVAYPKIAAKLYINDDRSFSLQPQENSQTLLELRQQKLAGNCPAKAREGKAAEENPTGAPDFPATATQTDLCFMNGKLGKGVVLLSEEQVGDLLDKLGLDAFDHYVEKLADFILRKQANVTNHYATILKWWQEDKGVI